MKPGIVRFWSDLDGLDAESQFGFEIDLMGVLNDGSLAHVPYMVVIGVLEEDGGSLFHDIFKGRVGCQIGCGCK